MSDVNSFQRTLPDLAARVSGGNYNTSTIVYLEQSSGLQRICSTLSSVSAGMGDRLRAGIPTR